MYPQCLIILWAYLNLFTKHFLYRINYQRPNVPANIEHSVLSMDFLNVRLDHLFTHLSVERKRSPVVRNHRTPQIIQVYKSCLCAWVWSAVVAVEWESKVWEMFLIMNTCRDSRR